MLSSNVDILLRNSLTVILPLCGQVKSPASYERRYRSKTCDICAARHRRSPGTPRYLLRDRDGNYGERFHKAADWMGVYEVLTAAQSPCQNAYVERLIGSIRLECLDHVMVLNEAGLRRMLRAYFDYYNRSRTHLALCKDAPAHRSVQQPATSEVIEILREGGLPNRYERRAA